MGSTAGRLTVARRAALRAAVIHAGSKIGMSGLTEDFVLEIETALRELGYRVSMIGGDMIWGAG